MKRSVFYMVTMLVTAGATGQHAGGDWDVIHVRHVNFSLPQGYASRHLDTIETFRGRNDSTILPANIVHLPQLIFRHERELTAFYGILAAHTGKPDQLLTTTILKVSGLTAERFTFSRGWNPGSSGNGLIVFADHYAYAFISIRARGSTVEDSKRFFSSISFHDLSQADQFGRDAQVERWERVGRAGRYVFVVLLLLSGFLWYTRKFYFVRIIITSLAVTLLLWAIFNVLIFAANYFLSKATPYSFLIMAGISIVLGVGLLLIPVPRENRDHHNPPPNSMDRLGP